MPRPALALFAALVLAACADPPPATAADAAAETTPPPTFGQRCDAATGCAAGLTCLQSDYSVWPWCAVACPVDKVKTYCAQADTSGHPALCVQLPKDFQGPATPWCLPICANKAACQTLDPQWEDCARPMYKNQKLVTDLQTEVCLSPSAHGQIKVDPVACDWQSKVGLEPQFTEAKQTCVALCKGLLKACQLWPKGKTEACCGWACYQFVTPGGQVDNARLGGPIKCLVKAFDAFQGTPEVCTGYKDQCGELPAWVQAP